MGPNQESKNVEVKNSKSPRFSLKSKKVKILLASLVAVIALGGVGAAVYVNSIYNKPENVLASAMGKYLLDGKDKNFDATMTMKMLDEASVASGMGSVEMKMGVQMSGKTTQIEMEANLAIFRLRGIVQANENGNLYIKVKDLPALLGSDVATAYGIPEEMKQQIASLDEKWIEITKENLAQLSGQEPGSSELDKCTEALYGALENDDLANDFDKFYRKHKFLVANNPVEEELDGKKLLKVEVGLDQAKLKAFGDAFGKNQAVIDLVAKCGLNSDEVVAGETLDGLKNGKMTAWLDRGKRELVRLDAGGDSFEEATKTGEIKFSMNVKAPAGKIEAPKEVVNIMDLVKNFGIDPSMLQGLGETSGV